MSLKTNTTISNEWPSFNFTIILAIITISQYGGFNTGIQLCFKLYSTIITIIIIIRGRP